MFPGHPTLHHIVVDSRLQDAYMQAERARRIAELRDLTRSTNGRNGVIRRAFGSMLVRLGERIQGSYRREIAETGAPSLGTLHIAR
jgi:hypothetical protein